ncbi:MAG TPA: twin-arginine translocase TatA/TatE family subunit [Rariglobus sp.]
MNCPSLFVAGVFGLGGAELLLILAIVVLLFGAKKLPELAKGLGKSVKEFKKASTEADEEESSEKKPAAKSETSKTHGSN